ncbi:glycerophosphodiester phosphodiesterase [Haloglomus irregulare]|jgi:glycerophosphoryl diester phosphodiesterase|uniref:Glycerophosphodiester phosphodiesterase n=1 Tax=Haloglomus irregulare TaxID=2234134 RepID=A0A554MXI7_9EURY|nr:glycerophosphodiester phosphodiesterase [Haloglomus irregulare]TSD09836.1 glycerophosphodiester phosphodiesterase [Haloglomus irregulare]
MDPTLVAHRGFAGSYPQNTELAVRRAAAHPETAMVEVDVQPVADGTPVVFHDSRLDTAADGGPGLTDREGVVHETPLAEVVAAEVLDSGETVPTLAAVRDARPDDVRLNVELKNPGSFDIRPGVDLDADDRATQRELWHPFVARVLDVLDGTDALLSSFCEGALAAAGEAGDHPTAALCAGTVDAAVAVARRHDCAAVHPSLDDLLGDDSRTDPPARPEARDRVLEAAAAQGWTVNAWTVTRWHEVARLDRLGVDGVIADHPAVTWPVG